MILTDLIIRTHGKIEVSMKETLQEKRNQTTLIRERLVKKVLAENDRQLLIFSI